MAFTPVASGDVIQSGAINSIVSGASFYSTDTGTDGVTYKVPFNSTATNKNTIPAFTDGLIISFRAAIANVGASTLQILTTGGTPLGGLSKAITKFDSFNPWNGKK